MLLLRGAGAWYILCMVTSLQILFELSVSEPRGAAAPACPLPLQQPGFPAAAHCAPLSVTHDPRIANSMARAVGARRRASDQSASLADRPAVRPQRPVPPAAMRPAWCTCRALRATPVLPTSQIHLSIPWSSIVELSSTVMRCSANCEVNKMTNIHRLGLVMLLTVAGFCALG
jgi:hypothetical protein